MSTNSYFGVMRSDVNSVEPIPNIVPHYTNERFKNAQSVWLVSRKKLTARGYVKGASYDYSDRLWQWDWHKAEAVRDSIDAKLDRRSPAYIQAFLRGYFDKPTLRLVHVMAGFNVSSGHPYQVYGYIDNTQATESTQPPVAG